MILWTIAIILLALAVYAVFLREWLKTKPWAQGFFEKIEPVERTLFKKSETILFARLKVLTGAILTILTQAGTLDITPIMPLIPEQHHTLFRTLWSCLPLAISIVGIMDESLRVQTKTPLDVVALPDKLSPDIERKVEEFQAAKQQVVAEIREAKAEGKV